jgi:hypothetical protein
MAASALFSLVGLFILATEPGGPSRRVLAVWEARRASRLTRFLGPGMARSALFVFLVSAASQLALLGVGVVAEEAGGAYPHAPLALTLFAGYSAAFVAFLCGLATLLRLRRGTRLRPRGALALGLFSAVFLPLFAVAIAGLSGGGSGQLHWLAAPSPIYVVAVVAEKTFLGTEASVIAAAASIFGWASLGAILGALGASRLRLKRVEDDAARALLDAELRREDEAAAAAAGTGA